jgi:hypothetical protein
MRSVFTHLVLAGALGWSAGCQSISDSVTSPSRWLGDSSGALADSSHALGESSEAVSQPFADSSRSSSPDDDEPQSGAYRDDVRVATRALADAPADELLRELSLVAERHGISHWEARAGTWRAVGAGLGEAGVSRADAEALSGRLGADAAARARLLEGHAAAL